MARTPSSSWTAATRLVSRATLLLLGVGVLLPAAQAQGQADTDERARRHFESGASYYEAGDYEDALREFRRSFELSEEPALYYNFSLCHQHMGNYDDAVDYLERYLNEVPTVENRPNLERRLENLRERASAEPDDPDTTVVDEEPDEVVQPPVIEDEGGVSPIAYVGFGIAAGGAVMLGVSGALALSARSDLDDDPCSATASCDASTLRRRAIVADVGLGLLVVGAALGVTFLFVGGDGDDSSARLELTPSAGPTGGGALLRGTF